MNDIATSNIARAANMNGGGKPDFSRIRTIDGLDVKGKRVLVRVDFNHNPASSIFDATLTKVTGGTLVKALGWYDNEWGFSNRMLDVTVALMNAK